MPLTVEVGPSPQGSPGLLRTPWVREAHLKHVAQVEGIRDLLQAAQTVNPTQHNVNIPLVTMYQILASGYQ